MGVNYCTWEPMETKGETQKNFVILRKNLCFDIFSLMLNLIPNSTPLAEILIKN